MRNARIRTFTVTVIAFLMWNTLSVAQTYVIEHVSVVPMTEETVLADQTLVVRGDRIHAMGASGEVKIPRKAKVIDGRGKFLIPGLIDLHIHFFGGREGNPGILKLNVATGVTTALNMRGMRGALELRDQVRRGEIIGPTVYTASPILGNVSPTPKTHAKGVEMVEQFVREGYDFIKVYNFIPREGYEGIIEAAARLNIPVVGHAVRSVGIEGALAAGQHMAHMEEVIYGYFKDDLDEAKILPLAKRFKDRGISVIATLIVYHNIIRQVEDIDAMLATPGIEYVPEKVTHNWQPERNEYLESFDQESIDKMLGPSMAFMQKLTKAFTEVGVPVLAGTDAGIAIVVPGYALHEELRELVAAGLSPYEALAAGTSKAAEFLGGAEEFGTVEVGKRADMILVRGNPLVDVAHTEDIEGVMLRGTWLDAAAIGKMLEEMRVEPTSN